MTNTQALIIRNANIYTMEQAGILEHCNVLIVDRKISAIGRDISCCDAAEVNANGLALIPGMIDAHCHAGAEITMTGDDANELSSPILPELDIIHSINIFEPYFSSLHRSGVTACCIVPGSGNVIGGLGATVKTAGKKSIRELAIRHPAALKCALGRMPIRCYGKRGLAPNSRMGAAGMLDEAFHKAMLYMNEKEKAAVNDLPFRKTEPSMEAISLVLQRKIPIKVHCMQDDMLTVIEIAKKYNIEYMLDHAWNCGQFSEEILSGGGAVCFGPIGNPEGFLDFRGSDLENIRELDDAGLPVCLVTDGPIYGAASLLIFAGEAVRSGIDPLRALAMITSNPARILKIDDRVGSIKVGKDADLVLLNGIPAVETGAKAVMTIIDGEIVYRDEAYDPLVLRK